MEKSKSDKPSHNTFVRKGKPIRYKTKHQGDKEVEELLLLDKLPDNIDNKVDR